MLIQQESSVCWIGQGRGHWGPEAAQLLDGSEQELGGDGSRAIEGEVMMTSVSIVPQKKSWFLKGDRYQGLLRCERLNLISG